MKTKDYIVMLIQKKYSIEKDKDMDQFNYIEAGYIDSMGLIQFIVELEEHFGIEFTQKEVESKEFCVVGGLTRLIDKKVSDKESKVK